MTYEIRLTSIKKTSIEAIVIIDVLNYTLICANIYKGGARVSEWSKAYFVTDHCHLTSSWVRAKVSAYVVI